MVGILPIKGSDDWMISIGFIDGTNENGHVRTRYIHDIKDFPDDEVIGGLGIGNGSEQQWTTISSKFAKEDLMPFIIRKMRNGGQIHFHGFMNSCHKSIGKWNHTKELTKIAEVLFGALNASTCTFRYMEMGYYGPFCEEFVTTQIVAGLLDSLNLYGWWPNGAVPLIKTYLDRYDKPRITLTEENKVPLSQEFFDSLFAKFLERKLYLRNMCATPEFAVDYFKALRVDLHVADKGGRCNILTWKSPLDYRDFFVVEFLAEDEVLLSTTNLGICMCPKKHKLCSGHFLCFCDADDVSFRNRIQTQVDRILSAAQPELTICGSNFVRNDDRATVRYTKWANELLDSQLLTQRFTSHGPTVVAPTWFLSRSLYNAVGGFNEAHRVGHPEDLEFFFEAVKIGSDVVKVAECLVMYRYHPNCATFSVDERTIWHMREVEDSPSPEASPDIEREFSVGRSPPSAAEPLAMSRSTSRKSLKRAKPASQEKKNAKKAKVEPVVPSPPQSESPPSLTSEPSPSQKADSRTPESQLNGVQPKLPDFVIVDSLLIHEDTYAGEKSIPCFCKLPEKIPENYKGCGDTCVNRASKFECGSRCPTGQYCSNKKFQKKAYAPVETFYCGPQKGWGVRATDNIDEGDFITEYVGEFIGQLEYYRRRWMYAQDPNHRHHYFMSASVGDVIDATKYGSISRFINHSCNPNCKTDNWMVKRRCRIGFFATRSIKKGEEIVFNYQWRSAGEPQKCYCGAPQCQGYIGVQQAPRVEKEPSDDESDIDFAELEPTKILEGLSTPSEEEHFEEHYVDVVLSSNADVIVTSVGNDIFDFADHKILEFLVPKNGKCDENMCILEITVGIDMPGKWKCNIRRECEMPDDMKLPKSIGELLSMDRRFIRISEIDVYDEVYNPSNGTVTSITKNEIVDKLIPFLNAQCLCYCSHYYNFGGYPKDLDEYFQVFQRYVNFYQLEVSYYDQHSEDYLVVHTKNNTRLGLDRF
ncbi:hypothetical protein QR680_010718 [Steinernema hermaphroditum]|uniref:Histone-lysine N-methyltransferase n=1 Tax=Steinernema hermaphroditum TaxID=289476 RepID=A0AA39IPX5_9BILA|nr:hypothetical protein QR680_010718 [Steinernema hermaphroditum]